MIKTKEDCLTALEDITAYLAAKEPILKAEYERLNNLLQRRRVKNGSSSAKNSSHPYLRDWAARNCYLDYIQKLEIAPYNAEALHSYLSKWHD